MTHTDWMYIALTAVIAVAAGFQAWFARRLWNLQKQIEDARKETAVYVALELLPSTGNREPWNTRVRFENASPVGVLLSRLVIVAKIKGKSAFPTNVDFRFSIDEYGSRDAVITKEVFDSCRSVEPADPAWQGGSTELSACLELTPHYLVAGKPHVGFEARYRLEFTGSSLRQVAILQPDDHFGKW